MNREEISAMIGNMADRHINEALEYENHMFLNSKRIWKKIAAAAAIFMIGVTGIGTITFAANVDFRNAVIQFISHFSEKEKNDIREGHLTANLSKEDALHIFLYQLQKEGKQLKYGENGFDYTFIEENSVDAKAIIACKNEKEYLLVELAGSEIEPEVFAWKVKSYQKITSGQAENLLSSNEKRAVLDEQEWTEEDAKKAQDNVIKATEKKGKIYRAINKNNIAVLTEEETALLVSMFEQYKEDDDNAWWGHGDSNNDYVILLPGQDIMLTKKGYVIRDTTGSETIAYILKADDLKRVKKILIKYNVWQ